MDFVKLGGLWVRFFLFHAYVLCGKNLRRLKYTVWEPGVDGLCVCLCFSLHQFLHHRADPVHADSLCGLPANQNQ